ncbi:MAG: hypothetical protein ACOYOK_14660, partial [Pseudobdellovibrionaceae bacterium]
EDAFADLVFHELLHTWVGEHLIRPSPLFHKYENEARLTRNHLHLMAVQKLIYQKLNRDDLIQMIQNQYNRHAEYKRAWDIVNAEGIQVFIDELKPPAKITTGR